MLIPEQILEKIVFTPGEKMVLREQCEGLSLSASFFIDATDVGDPKKALDLFSAMSVGMELIQAVLQAKTNVAMRRYHNEDTQDE